MTNSDKDFHQKIVGILSERYDRRLINNKERGEYVETMVSELLGEDWELTWKMPKHNSWSAWDIENKVTKQKIEVKQSASWQAWETQKPSVPRFGIEERGDIYLGDSGGKVGDYERFETPKRVVDLYIFAWHGASSRKDADHRDRTQWEFYVVPSGKLPKAQKSIGLSSIRDIANPVKFNMLAQTVRDMLAESNANQC